MLGRVSKGGNNTLHLKSAKKNKNDEFYTRYEDIENEIFKYVEKSPSLFFNKVVYCPCDDYEWSNFVKFFVNNFSRLGIKKLISTCKIDGRGKKFVLSKGDIIGKASLLSSNGDFRNEELRDYFNSADIIVTNPPFSIIGYFRTDSQANRVYSIRGKAVTLCGESGGGAAKMGQYFFGCIDTVRLNKRQNGPRLNDGKKSYTLTVQDRQGVLLDGYIRKLTPIECERLQTLPDNYTEGISNTQRYKCLGNGWTVDIISQILKNVGGSCD